MMILARLTNRAGPKHIEKFRSIVPVRCSPQTANTDLQKKFIYSCDRLPMVRWMAHIHMHMWAALLDTVRCLNNKRGHELVKGML